MKAQISSNLGQDPWMLSGKLSVKALKKRIKNPKLLFVKELSKISIYPWTKNANHIFFKYERWMKNIYAWQMHDYIIRMLKISLKYWLFCLTLTSGWLKRSRRSVMGSACRMRMCTWMQGLRTLPVVSLEGSEESRTRNRSHMMLWVYWHMIMKW